MSTTAPPADFGFGEDETLLRDTARKFLDEQLPETRLRALVANDQVAVYDDGQRPGWDEGLWKQIVELGWTGLAVPEEAGGLGFRMAGIAGLVEEVGRHALPSPLVATIAASLLLRACEGDTAAAWLGRIADGEAASLALTGEDGDWERPSADVEATADGDELRLDGKACFVQDAFKVGFVLASVRQGQAQLICAVPTDAEGLRLEQDHIHDLTRDQATLHFEGVRVAADAVVSQQAEAALERARPALLGVVTADLCGCAEWQLQTTVEYAKTRTQFERQIGFFQAVKHPLVDAMVMIDRARSLLYRAAACIDVGSADAEQFARMAKSAASDAGAFVSDRSVQLHGGIGFTWECDVHIWFKRSMHNQALYGDGVHQRRLLADAMIGPLA